MLIVSIAQVQPAYNWAPFALHYRLSSTLNAAVPGVSLANATVLKTIIIFIQLLTKAKLDSVVPNKPGFYFKKALPSNHCVWLEPHNVYKLPRAITKTGIERELSLGCAFTYQPTAFGCRPAWQMGLGSRARSGAVGDN